MEALALIHDAGRCYGAIVRNLVTGELVAYVAKATAIASGGAGRLYRATTNAVICEGIGTALALETGVATVGNMEAIQFHPDRHFPGRHPGHRGLPRRRRTAARRRRQALHARLRAGEEGARIARRRRPPHGGAHSRAARACKSRFGEHLWLDITLLGARSHQQQSARSEGDLPLLPRHRSDQGLDTRASRAALHDGRRPHRSHRREPDAEGPVRGGRSGVLGPARLQPPGRQFGRRNRGRRHDRRRIHRRFLRSSRERRAAFDRTDPRVPVTASRPSSTRSSTATARRRRTRSAAGCRTS